MLLVNLTYTCAFVEAGLKAECDDSAGQNPDKDGKIILGGAAEASVLHSVPESPSCRRAGSEHRRLSAPLVASRYDGDMGVS